MEAFDFSEVKYLFKSKKRIFLTAHSNPDGDAIGAVLALYHFFLQAGHEVYAMAPNRFPDFLSWMKGKEHVLIYEEQKTRCDELMGSADVLFSLDYNSPNRIGVAEESFTKAKGTKILIDHHIEPDKAAYDHCFSTTQISSTSELVYLFMKALDDCLINKAIGECVYAGIMTDTGSFSYNCNYETTFTIVSELISKGLDATRINRLVYSTNTESRLRLLGYSLSEKLMVLPEYHTAYISLDKQELQKYNYKTGDTEGLVNYALSIEGIRFAALFTERKDKIRASFRSVGNFSVNAFAKEHYEGGGHKNAAGGDSFVSMDQTIKQFERLLVEYGEFLK